MRSAERGVRNGFTTRCYVHKDLFKCGMRSAEQPYGVRSAERGTRSNACASAECGTRSAERLHYALLRSQGKYL